MENKGEVKQIGKIEINKTMNEEINRKRGR